MLPDPLTDLLTTIDLHGQSYFCTHFTAPWGFEVADDSVNAFHAIIEGQCWLTINAEPNLGPILLKKGDIIAFPTGGGHTLSDKPGSARISSETLINDVIAGNNPFDQQQDNIEQSPATKTLILCGSFSYDRLVDHPFLQQLPCHILLHTQESATLNRLHQLLASMADESIHQRPGGSIIVDRLSEILFIQLVRAYLSENQQEIPYLAALSTPKIGKALQLIHQETDGGLTVQKLADATHLSRGNFTEKFTEALGLAPKRYLVNWRMQKARYQLTNSGDAMIKIAEAAGYNSEAAFSKAFKAYFQLSPGKLRR